MPCTVGIVRDNNKPCRVYMNMQLEEYGDARLIVFTPTFAMTLARLLAESAQAAVRADLGSAVPSPN